jgi:hypothetical protein
VRKSRRLSEERDNEKPDAKTSSRPEATEPTAAAPAGRTSSLPSSTSSIQPTSSTQSRRIQQPADTAETRRRREEEYHGYSQEEPRPRFENEHKSTTHAEQSLKASDLLPESKNGIMIAYQIENPRSYQLRRVSYGSTTSIKQHNHGICTTLRRMTESFTANRCYANHHDA